MSGSRANFYCSQFQSSYQHALSLSSYLNNEFNQLAQKGNIQRLNALMQETTYIEKFRNEYQQRVREMLKDWYPIKAYPFWNDFTDSIDFEDDQRVIVRGSVMIPNTTVNYFPQLIRAIKGTAFLNDTQIESLDYLEEVGEDLHLGRTPNLRSAKRLRKVNGQIIINNSGLAALDALEEVGGNLWIRSNVKNLMSMAKIKRIGGNVDFGDSQIATLDTLKEVGGHFYAGSNSSLRSMSSLKKIGLYGSFRGTQINNLDSLEEVGSGLDLNNMPNMQSVKKLRTVGGELQIIDTDIDNFEQAFPSLRHVGMDMNGYSIYVSTPIKDQINNLKKEGKLYLEGGVVSTGKLP